jgi:tetratricopeptide (TPR) repeat protein
LLRLAPYAALGAAIVACGLRTCQRNTDWKDDVALATAAMRTSPRSFRPYTSLAGALREQNRPGDLDRAIELAAQGVRIIEELPDELNNSGPYVQLGGYYLSKADSLCQTEADGSRKVTGAARQYYLAAAETLERAIPIDRAFNELNHRRDLQRGKQPAQSPDNGSSSLYTNLSQAYLRLERTDKAIQSMQYARHLTPLQWEPWFQLGELQLAAGRPDEACVTLIQCLIMEPGRDQAWPLLQRAYLQIDTGPIPAIQTRQGVPGLNLENPLVMEHFRRAYQDLVRTYRHARRLPTADAIRTAALQRHGLPAELFAPSADESNLPVPPEPVFYVRGEPLPGVSAALPSASPSH